MEASIHYIVMALLLAIAAGIGGLFGKYIMALIGGIVDARIRKIVDSLVRAAAQSVPDKGDRYAWVAERLATKFKWLTTVGIQELIEAAVYRMKQELQVQVQQKVISVPTVTLPDPTKAA